MKILIQITTLIIILVSPLYATTLTMCPGGGVKSGDTWEDVQKKCGKFSSTASTTFITDKNRHDLTTKKIVFKDGTAIMFIFVDNHVVLGQILN